MLENIKPHECSWNDSFTYIEHDVAEDGNLVTFVLRKCPVCGTLRGSRYDAYGGETLTAAEVLATWRKYFVKV